MTIRLGNVAGFATIGALMGAMATLLVVTQSVTGGQRPDVSRSSPG